MKANESGSIARAPNHNASFYKPPSHSTSKFIGNPGRSWPSVNITNKADGASFEIAFGEKCKHEHVQDASKGFGNQTWTGNSSSQSTSKPATGAGILSIENMTKDLTLGQEKPLWPLTSYGPVKCQPMLIGGVDESFEELRVLAVAALKSGAINDYTKYEADKIAAADSIYSDARSNIKQTYEQAKRQYSDSDTKSSDTSVFGQSSIFGAPANSGASFGGGGTTSAFGTTVAPTPAFGQPAFGQSAFSQPTNPPATVSAFGQPLQATSAFGQPSQTTAPVVKPASGAFGSSASGGAFSAFAGTGASAFGSGSAFSGGNQGGAFSAFAGQPSAFGSSATSNTTTAPSGSSVFGQSAFGSAPTATTSVFGTPATTTTSTFGQPSVFGAAGSAFGGSVFANQNSTGSVFGPGGSASTSTPSVNPTGSVFGPGGSASTSVPANTGSVFGPGGSASTSPFSHGNNAPFSAVSSASAFGNQSLSAFTSSSPQSAFVSEPSASSLPPKPQSGPPNFANAKSPYKPNIDQYDSLLPQNYLQLLPQAVKAAFESEKFVWGNIPEWTPPKELR